ncbi:MAG TPA: proton-conducting transporter membrane subunit [Polyangia bacterium]|nr:proton-conducting transporter membrane subunit [Polyangia bacterium]
MSLAPLPVALPLVAAAALASASDHVPRRLSQAVALLVALTVTGMGVALVLHTSGAQDLHWFGGWRPRGQVVVGIAFVVDPVGAGLVALSGALVTLALLFTTEYFDEVGAGFHGLILIFLAALSGFALTGDLFNLFVFFELMSVAAFALCAYKIEDDAALIGAFNFGVTNTVGATLVVLGLALTYARAGALNFAQIAVALAGRGDALVTVAFVLLACGFLVKAAVVPFHFWLADAHAVAPTPVCVLFSGVMVEAALYAVARLAWSAFGTTLARAPGALRPLFVGAGVSTAVIGASLCFAQRHLKRLLAFSTIAHLGLMLIGVGLFDADALGGVALYTLGHGFVKGALFLTVGIVLHRLRAVDELRLAGRGRRLPWVAALLTAGGVALAGGPPFATFLGDEAISRAAAALRWTWLSWVFTFTSGMTAAALLRVVGRVCLGLGARAEDVGGVGGQQDESPETRPRDRTPVTMWTPPLAGLALGLALGLAPQIRDGAARAAARFVSPDFYVASVLGTRSPPFSADLRRAFDPSELLRAGATLAGAFALAALALLRDRVPRRLRRVVASAGTPALRGLRLLHGGHVGEYVAWITIGVAAWGGAALVLLRHAAPR